MKPASFDAFFAKFRADFAASQSEQKAIAIDGILHRPEKWAPVFGAMEEKERSTWKIQTFRCVWYKEMRRSFDKTAEQSNLNVVTAFAHGLRLSLGITKSAKAGGEILALRDLIDMLDIQGITVTADALHCQRETCELIVKNGGDCCLQLKRNQGNMWADVQAFVQDQGTDYADKYTSTDADHGRIEE